TGSQLVDAPEANRLRLRIMPRHEWGLGIILKTLATRYRARSILGLALMASQAFLYNAIFFTYALVLSRYYGVAPGVTGFYLFPFAIGNFIGPLVLGPLFDTLGRRQMISATYTFSALVLSITG